jgi:hypothetical protein
VATVLTALQAESGGTDYIYARRIGSIVRSGATILAFTQRADNFIWTTPTFDYDTATSGTSAYIVTLTVPTGIRVIARLNCYTANGALYVSPFVSTDSAPSVTAAPLGTTADGASSGAMAPLDILTDTSGQVRARCSTNTANRIVTRGYNDWRGKDA